MMMKRIMKLNNTKIVGMMFGISGMLVVLGWGIRLVLGENVAVEGENMTVAATIFPVYDMTRKIAAEGIEVELLLQPGSSPHTFDLDPGMAKKLARTDVVYMIGHGVDDWIRDEAANLGVKRLAVVDREIKLMEYGVSGEDETGGHGRGGVDPHYWLSGANALLMSRNIKESLKILYPMYAEEIEDRYQEYAKELAKMDVEMRNMFLGLGNRKMAVFHPAWGYFARDYGLEVVAIFEENAGVNPDPKHVAFFIDKIRENQLAVVYTEPQFSDDQLLGLIKDAGIVTAELDPLGGVWGRESYVELMKYNASRIVNAQK